MKFTETFYPCINGTEIMHQEILDDYNEFLEEYKSRVVVCRFGLNQRDAAYEMFEFLEMNDLKADWGDTNSDGVAITLPEKQINKFRKLQQKFNKFCSHLID